MVPQASCRQDQLSFPVPTQKCAGPSGPSVTSIQRRFGVRLFQCVGQEGCLDGHSHVLSRPCPIHFIDRPARQKKDPARTRSEPGGSASRVYLVFDGSARPVTTSP